MKYGSSTTYFEPLFKRTTEESNKLGRRGDGKNARDLPILGTCQELDKILELLLYLSVKYMWCPTKSGLAVGMLELPD